VLNNLQAIDEEGMPIFDTNTKKGGLRKIAQFSGLVKALLEGNSQENHSFDYSLILPLYNKGNKLQTTAIKSFDTRTNEIPFLGSLMFVQNIEPFKFRSEKERVISLKFSSEMITEETKLSFEKLMNLSPQDLATFIVKILNNKGYIEKHWRSYFKNNKEILSQIDDNRIIENHALILTFHQLVCDILRIDFNLEPFIIEIAGLKKESCSKNDNPIFDHFFEEIDEIDDAISSQFCEIKNKRLYLNLPNAMKCLVNQGFHLPPSCILIKALKEHRAFIGSGLKFRFMAEASKGKDDRPKQRRVYEFDIEKM
jgi:hypothetical protein